MATTKTLIRRLALSACIAAVVAPTAAANYDPWAGGSDSTAQPQPAPPVVRPVIVRSTGFDWSDAAIGAGAATAFTAAIASGALLIRRPRTETHSAIDERWA